MYHPNLSAEMFCFLSFFFIFVYLRPFDSLETKQTGETLSLLGSNKNEEQPWSLQKGL